MNVFNLWFPKSGETTFIGKSAYIEVLNPFADATRQHGSVKSEGRVLLYNEATSAEECCTQIDALIRDLQSLKAKAKRDFKNN